MFLILISLLMVAVLFLNVIQKYLMIMKMRLLLNKYLLILESFLEILMTLKWLKRDKCWLVNLSILRIMSYLMNNLWYYKKVLLLWPVSMLYKGFTILKKRLIYGESSIMKNLKKVLKTYNSLGISVTFQVLRMFLRMLKSRLN